MTTPVDDGPYYIVGVDMFSYEGYVYRDYSKPGYPPTQYTKSEAEAVRDAKIAEIKQRNGFNNPINDQVRVVDKKGLVEFQVRYGV